MKSIRAGNIPQGRQRIRWTVRIWCLLVAIALLLPWIANGQWMFVVPAISPWVALCAVTSGRAFSWVLIPGLLLMLVVCFRRRWLCRWICPTGLLADTVGRLGRSIGRRCPRWPPIGQWVAIITFAGSLVGYPLLLWLDPLAMFSSALTANSGVTGAAAWLSVMGLGGVLLVSVLWPGIWCHHLCPLGGAQEILVQIQSATRPSETTSMDPTPEVNRATAGLTRRVVLGSVVGVAWAAGAKRLSATPSPGLRPPGAIDEVDFAGLCIRCGNCTQACPAGIIRPDLGSHGVARLLTPYVSFQQDYCHEDCTRCSEVCPSGAIRRFTLSDKTDIRMGLAQVDMEICLLRENRECAACRNHCPFDAVSYVWSDIDYMLTPEVDPSKCPGCGACEVACPTAPNKAIVVMPRDSSL
jgi:ferredoxin-type protein NapG